MAEKELNDAVAGDSGSQTGSGDSDAQGETKSAGKKGLTRGGAGSQGGRPMPLLLIGIIAGAVLLGGAGGSMLLAPKLRAAAPEKANEESAEKAPAQESHAKKVEKSDAHGKDSGKSDPHKKKSDKKSKGAHGSGGTVFRVESIIVNPAGTQGTRFLMATIAFEFSDPKAEERMRDSEVRVRDLVVTVLENQTMEALTQPGARDRVKRQLAAAVMDIADDPHMVVYLPQFIIQ